MASSYCIVAEEFFMHPYTDAYLSTVKQMWHKYLKNNLPLPASAPAIRSDIFASWKRSQQYGVKVDTSLNFALSKDEFEVALSASRRLLEVAYPYLSDLYNFVKGTNFLIHICDKNGNILKCLSDDQLIQNLSRSVSKLGEGSVRTEQLSGTDSASLCLATQKPVQVLGEEHYLSKNHAFFCSSAPIFNENDEFVAVLTMMGPRELYQHHTLGMVCAAVSSIEKELRMQKAHIDLTLTNSILNSTIESLESGVVILDANRTIVQCNKRALDILNIPSAEHVVRKSFFSIFNRDSVPKQIRSLDSDMKNFEFTALTTNSEQVHLNLTVSAVRNQANDIETIVLIFDEQKHVYKLVNKLSGFSASYTFDSIIGTSASIKEVKEMALNAARSASNVLISGESGTGKELLAQAIHNASDCATGPFIAVNCGSIPKTLIESELFGYEEGAFTGAKKEGHPGKFELADGGTIFLDEICDMPLELQSTLLRVLQMREITRIGGKYSKKINVRVIAATNVDLKEAVRMKSFRNDLYYRLNVLGIAMPSLRERIEDVPYLVNHFISNYSADMHKNIKGISQEAMNLLTSYTWPGNVRELENIIERAINMTQNDIISLNEIPVEIATFSTHETVKKQDLSQNNSYASQKARNSLLQLLEQESGNVSAVAGILNMPVSTLYRKFKKYNINPKNYKL